ncbi:MAG: 50S ribosomal protein L23 [Bdellovibrio sp.]|nr:50S ribosomal protein L23 [Bdellovibrio sp.]
MRTVFEVVRRPIISEKSTALAEVGGRYSFEVALKANKQEIKDAIQRLFNVKVRNVHTMVMHGKVKRVGRFETKRTNWKKAMVTLAEGQKIDFFQTK